MHVPGSDQCPPFDLSRFSCQPNPQEAGFPCPKELATRAPGRFSAKMMVNSRQKLLRKKQRLTSLVLQDPLVYCGDCNLHEVKPQSVGELHLTSLRPPPQPPGARQGAVSTLRLCNVSSILSLSARPLPTASFRAATWSSRLRQGAPTPTANPPDSCWHQGPSDLQL